MNTTNNQQGESVDLDKLEALARAATPGPWDTETVRSEGEYGTDEDSGHGFDAYAVVDSKGRPLMDSLNRDDSSIHTDTDGDFFYAWDELAKRDAQFIAAANPTVILALIAQARASQPAASDAQPGADERALPKLPEPEDVDYVRYAYTAEQMQDYGSECYDAALATPAVQAGATVAAEALMAPCEGGSILPDSCSDCRREGSPCALAAPASPATQPADWTVDDSELARKIMVFLGHSTTASMEPGADPLRDRLAEKLALWRPATQPAASDAQPGADERALFEAWYGENYTTYLPRMREGKYAGEYVNSGTQMIWRAWQARAALATPAVQAGATVAAEPIYQFSSLGEGNWSDCTKTFFDDCPKYKYHRRIVYAAPASPATQPAAMDAAIDDGIPAGVYYNPDSRNFYDAKGVGMGWDFYIQWRECRDMFPKSRAAMSASVSEQLTPHDADIERLLDAADHAAPATQAADTDARDAARGKWLIERGFKYANVDMTSDGDDTAFVVFHPRFYIPEPAGMPYDNGEWTVHDIRAAIDAAMSASVSEADGSGKGGAA